MVVEVEGGSGSQPPRLVQFIVRAPMAGYDISRFDFNCDLDSRENGRSGTGEDTDLLWEVRNLLVVICCKFYSGGYH